MKNILMIICDQLSASALKAYGNSYVDAPNIDKIAKNGVVFENAYTTCPLCQPARSSFWTSKYPHQTKVISNLPNQGFSTLSKDIVTTGELFANAGYDTVHFGKDHSYGGLRGFNVIPSVEVKIPRHDEAINYDYETYLDVDTTNKVINYLQNTPDKPFFAVADLQNPHNICGYIGENMESHKQFNLERDLPPLPDNYDFDDIKNRPEFIQFLCCAHRRQRHAAHWNDDDFRHYLYAYYYYISLVDKQIGNILTALEDSGKSDDTLIVFFADHGEGMASHKLVTKYGAFYEETNRVPLVFSGSMLKPSRIDGVCSVLDILPTLLDFADIEKPEALEGISHIKALMGLQESTDNDYVCGEWYDEFKDYTVPGRMITDGDFKYIIYREENSEELYDMQNDRLETVNLANNPVYTEKMAYYRALMKEHIVKTKDNFFELQSNYDKLHRSHQIGMHNHSGLSSVELYAQSLKK